MKPKDNRIPALIRFASAITILNLFGHFYLGFETSFAHPIAAVITAYTLEIGFEKLNSLIQKRKPAYLGGVKNLILFLWGRLAAKSRNSFERSPSPAISKCAFTVLIALIRFSNPLPLFKAP